MIKRSCLACGRPTEPGSTHPACEFCGGVLETVGEPVTRKCYRCGAAFPSDTASSETFCAACVALRDTSPPPAQEPAWRSMLQAVARDLGFGALTGVVGVGAFFLLRAFDFKPSLFWVLPLLLLAPIASVGSLFESEATRRARHRQQWSLAAITQEAGALAVVGLAYGLWSLFQ